MLQAGQMIAHFKIIRKLGEGGMGEVFLAEDQKLTRQVAIKTLSKDVFGDKERQERFNREARTAAQITHPNVMAIYDIGSAVDPNNNQAIEYIVMEYVKGQPLAGYLNEIRPDINKKIRLAEKIANGLAAAHQMNIVHRDIKSENLLVDDQGNPKILDFGLAKPVDPFQMSDDSKSTNTVSQELTRAGKILGTVKYMSPEQVQGKPVDSRSDIFSFGILIYSLFTGEMPFAGETQVSTMAKILEVAHESPRLKNENIPPELERIIDKCLQKDADDRYQDTRDLVVDLRNLRRHFDSGVTGAISTITDKPSGITLKFEAKPKAKSVGIFIGVIALVIISLIYFKDLKFKFSTYPSVNANLLAIIGFENKTGDSEFDWLKSGLPEILLTDLSQSDVIQIVSHQRLIDYMPVEEREIQSNTQLRKAAKDLGAGKVLSGSFFKMGDRLRIDARLEEIESGTILFSETVSGDDPFKLVDSLSKNIAASLNLGEIEHLTSVALSTPEAFKQYHLGMERFWAGDYDEAAEKFNEALAIDSTFALPYMRLGMASAFLGRQSTAKGYLEKAKEYEAKLPIRDRNMLDVYNDFWVNQKFSDGYAKLKTMAQTYPEDAEIRTIFGLLIYSFTKDTLTSFAHFDTVLQTYPNFPFTLSQYSEILTNIGDYENATKLVKRLENVLPEEYLPKFRLARLYDRQDMRKEAEAVYKELVEKSPNQETPYDMLISYAIKRRDFKAAEKYALQKKNLKPDDLYSLEDYEGTMGMIHLWRGEFKKNMDCRWDALEYAISTNDSQRITDNYRRISTYYRWYNMNDSGIYYIKESNKTAETFSKLSYPITLVSIYPERGNEVRPIFRQAIDDFKSRVPSSFWTVIEGLDSIFEGLCRSDTNTIINGYKHVIETQDEKNGGNVFELGQLYIDNRQYEKGIELLSRFTAGEYESSSGWVYPMSCYYLGIAYEAIGEIDRAKKNYQEMLKYWGKPDMELKEIKDARQRLTRLTS